MEGGRAWTDSIIGPELQGLEVFMQIYEPTPISESDIFCNFCKNQAEF